MEKKITIYLIIGILAFIIIGMLDNNIKTREITIYDKRVNDVKIALLADIHSEKVDVVNKINDADFIIIAGDSFDEKKDYKVTLKLLKSLAKKKNIYITLGNHDLRTMKKVNIIDKLNKIENLKLINGNVVNISYNGSRINLLGLTDPENNYEEFCAQIDNYKNFKSRDYTILISHRPEKLYDYENLNVDLIVSGHAHGGQWQIPGILDNGLLAPHQGFFPKYTDGLYKINKKQKLIVSPGLCTKNVIVPRIYNPPEIIIINIKKEQLT